jgi:glycosyltransferase involved in cell wall biosynthesis
MKKILYLTFYYEPDLSAGSFRNTALVKELARQSITDVKIDLYTTQPNRYNSFKSTAPEYEVLDNIYIHRINIPKHQSKMKDQIISYKTYFIEVMKRTKTEKYDIVFASTSRLFTAYLGYKIAQRNNTILYVDVRDIFYDTMKDVLKNKLIKKLVLPCIKYIEKKTFNFATHINLISKGFIPYFSSYKKNYSYYTNGIDTVFEDATEKMSIKNNLPNETKTIVYAGNIGEGQGLHAIIPEIAKNLPEYQFIIIGDGGAKHKLERALSKHKINNVSLRNPVKRNELIEIYGNAGFLFLHLNDYKAFEKVLPSKIFEYAAFDKPIIAGVGGYAYKFLEQNVSNVILFSPSNASEMIDKLNVYKYENHTRIEFIKKFKRVNIDKEMAKSILKYLQ